MNEFTHKPTEEQQAVIDEVQSSGDNILVKALAGSGKTSTLILIMRNTQADSVLFLAFNLRIKDAMQAKYKAALEAGLALPKTEFRSFHSIGLQVCRTIFSKVNVNTGKMREILSAEINKLQSPKAKREASAAWSEVLAAVGLAKNYGYVPDRFLSSATRLCDYDTLLTKLDETPDGMVEDLLEACMVTSIKTAYQGNIDLDDEVYLPAILGGTYPRNYEDLLVDEGQDLNACQHQMLWHMRKLRIMAVGDDNQSIYAFRGAVPGGMAKMSERFKMREYDLSICFRCPEMVVRNVLWRTPHMKWFKPGGHVERLKYADASTFSDNAAIICRNNAPLFSLAFRLLAAGRSVTVSGTDIGTRVIGLLKKLGNDEMNQAQLLGAIQQWREEKLAKQSVTANDTADCMKVFAEKGDNLAQAIAYAEALFAQHGPLTLTTGHKSKGLEWDTVYHLDPWLINDGGGDQELNLRYVIQTRALDKYFEINSAEINLDDNK